VTTQDHVVGVIGLGYVGLPLAVSLAEAELDVVGMDTSQRRLDEISSGVSPIGDVTDERLASALRERFRVAPSSPETIASCDVVFVCVPTPMDRAKSPDLSFVLGAAATIRSGLRPGQLVILQSTTYPGTTSGPFREELERGGLVAGQDFDLAYAPERVNPGDPASFGARIPRIVGGVTRQAGVRAGRVLERIADSVLVLSSPDAAELAKLHENVFRNVNIALANQLALLCERMGIDVWEVIDAASTKPFGFMRFTPGPGVGGHCIPVDPYYLAWRAREFDFVDRFIETAGDVNLAMPRHVVALCSAAVNDRQSSLRGARVGVLGVAFKPEVDDARNSPAAAIMALLRDQGADVRYHDPFVPRFRDADGQIHESHGLSELIDASDLLVIVTAHKAIDWSAVFASEAVVIDTVNASKGRSVRPRSVMRLGAGWGTQASMERETVLAGE
jgi:UDP-N-acetyl-D-glucosamine dehydrogenase